MKLVLIEENDIKVRELLRELEEKLIEKYAEFEEDHNNRARLENECDEIREEYLRLISRVWRQALIFSEEFNK